MNILHIKIYRDTEDEELKSYTRAQTKLHRGVKPKTKYVADDDDDDDYVQASYDSEDEEPTYTSAPPRGVKPKSRGYVAGPDFVQASYGGGDSDDEEPQNYPRGPQRSYSAAKPKSRRYVTADDHVATGVEWIRARNGEYPPNAVVGGKNHHGEIYVARAEYQGQLVPGKLIPTYSSCFISVHGTEVKVKDYEVLQCNKPTMLEWLTMETGDGISVNAVEAGIDDVGDTLFIGRAEHGKGEIVGKVEQSTETCLILCATQEYAYSNYDILVYSDTYLKKIAVSHLAGAMRNMQVVQDGHTATNSSSGRRQQQQSLLQTPARPTFGPGSPAGPRQPSLLQTPSLPNSGASSGANPISSAVQRKPLKKGFSVELLAPTDSTYKWLEAKMKKDSKVNYTIVKIERILNESLWMRYSNHRRLVVKLENNDDPNEKRLFHGSAHCQDIIKNGFDERLSAVSGLYGAGVYFADKADKSNCYVGAGNAAGEFQMIMCRVALGKVHDCPQNTKFSHAPPGCHSVCGGTTFKEYIVYRGEQAFPGYLITYKR